MFQDRIQNIWKQGGDNMKFIIEKKAQDWLEPYSISCAAKALNGNAFKLFIYLNNYHVDKDICDITPIQYINFFGGNRTGFQRSINELLEKGYLIKNSDENFLFTNVPPTQNV